MKYGFSVLEALGSLKEFALSNLRFPTVGDTQLAQLSSAMEMIIDFVPNVFLVIDDDGGEEDPDIEQNIRELKKNLADLIKQVLLLGSICT